MVPPCLESDWLTSSTTAWYESEKPRAVATTSVCGGVPKAVSALSTSNPAAPPMTRPLSPMTAFAGIPSKMKAARGQSFPARGYKATQRHILRR